MTRIASALSILALCAAVVAYAITHWSFPRVGFEGALVYGAMSFWAGAIAAGISALICTELYIVKRLRLIWPFAGAVLAGLVLFLTVRFP